MTQGPENPIKPEEKGKEIPSKDPNRIDRITIIREESEEEPVPFPSVLVYEKEREQDEKTKQQ